MELRCRGTLLPALAPPSSRALQRYATKLKLHYSSKRLPCLKTSEDFTTSSSTLASAANARIENELDREEQEQTALLEALKQWKTQVAWTKFETMTKKLGVLPDRVCVSRLVAQLCHQGTAASVSKAQQIMVELRQKRKVSELVDCDAMGLLVMASARVGTAHYSLGVLRTMLELGYHPPVKVWSALVSKLGKNVDDAQLALKVFDEVCQCVAEQGMIQLHRKMEVDGKIVDEKLTKSDEDKALIAVDETKLTRRSDENTFGTGSGYTEKKEAASTLLVVTAEREEIDDLEPEQREKLTNIQLKEERQALKRMKPDTGAFNAALNACANIGNLERAEQLWELMPAFGVKANTLTFNVMIKLYARVEKLDKLEQILHTMADADVDPDATTFNSLVAAFVGLGELSLAESIVQSLRGEGEHQTRVPALLPKLREHSAKFQPDVRTYTTLMKGYVQHNRVSDAMQLLVAMQQEKTSAAMPNEVTFTTAIRACAKMGLLDEARVILQEMATQKVAANVVTYNTLLQGVCVFPITDMKRALEIVEDMKEAGVELDVVSYNTLINGYLEAGDNEQALAAFTRMREAKVPASKVTYGTLMKAFARSGRTELVVKVFTQMALDPRVRVDVVAWNTLIDAYARAGLEQDATRALEDMKSRGFSPTNATYNTLVKTYGRSRNFGLLILLWKEINARSVEEDSAAVRDKPLVVGALKPDAALLDSLIDSFVRGGYFQLALQVVDCMDRQGIHSGRAKAKYKRLYVELYANLYTSRHTSERRKSKTAERRRAVEAFKFWVGLPNSLYKSEWRPFE
ncbi:pentatricopeptide repeat-containing protein At3g09650, chloroplastic [Selaginella moellendorffii]|uniref:pentatricopeptide repeat-containing protein At3g09650, chloroplastic n=1 Tax=Selaginella moellendorffii TaxID=88036 RepID=UPI000D1D0C41|nr:pentatricopeptide repeat-containing protein At3g09650, chloroplastic [Selaginella moellendorffii]|eukprot:XP_024524935.1 pentatricopeptide repeat-containing protein At3g09650, chloroplastic [Selaginella moellendorffii]